MPDSAADVYSGIQAGAASIALLDQIIKDSNSGRSIAIEFDNNTDLVLTRTGEELWHGGYAEIPTHQAEAHAPALWGAISAGGALFTGCEGFNTWTGGNVTLTVYWDNPFIGGNSCRADLTGPDADHYTVFAAIGAGNNAHMRVELFTSGADFVIQQGPPPSMELYHSASVSVTMRNTSLHIWKVTDTFGLGSQAPEDNVNWGVNRVHIPNDVPPGQTVTFNFDVTSSTDTGTFAFSWRMVQDGVRWFGDYTPVIPVYVYVPKTKEKDKEKEEEKHGHGHTKDERDDRVFLSTVRVPAGVTARTHGGDKPEEGGESSTFIGEGERSHPGTATPS